MDFLRSTKCKLITKMTTTEAECNWIHPKNVFPLLLFFSFVYEYISFIIQGVPASFGLILNSPDWPILVGTPCRLDAYIFFLFLHSTYLRSISDPCLLSIFWCIQRPEYTRYYFTIVCKLLLIWTKTGNCSTLPQTIKSRLQQS